MNYAVVPGLPPTVLRAQPNPDLNAVDLLAVEAGYRAKPASGLYLDLALFYNQYDDLVISQAATPFLEVTPPPPHLVIPSVYQNAMHGTSFGGEVAATWQPLDAWKITGSYGHLHMRLRSEPPGATGERLKGDSPVHQFQVRNAVDLPHDLTVDASLHYVDDLRSQGVDEYLRLDVRLAWRPLRGLEVSLVGQNLLEARHPEYVSYTMPAAEIQRSVVASITWQF
jgi:iron complex outermembrane receptor protein